MRLTFIVTRPESDGRGRVRSYCRPARDDADGFFLGRGPDPEIEVEDVRADWERTYQEGLRR